MALCVVDFDNKKLQYSGAFRPMYPIRSRELNVFKGDNMPIGIYNDNAVSFSNKEVQFVENDIIYLFTDGYVDQIGGPNRKTFRSKKFKQLLIDIHQLPMEKQKEILPKCMAPGHTSGPANARRGSRGGKVVRRRADRSGNTHDANFLGELREMIAGRQESPGPQLSVSRQARAKV